MPYIETYVEPEILFLYEGVPVCLTYKNGNANEPYQYIYAIGIPTDGENDHEFDVRGLSQFGADPHKPIPSYARGREYHRDIIREALAHGELDDILENAGFIPGLGAWKQDMNDLNVNQLFELLRSYNDYIQTANEENRYQSGWMPVSIREYYGAEFEQELRDKKEANHKLAIDIFAAQLTELRERAGEKVENNEEDTDENRS